jgi:hypothetical protein
LTSTNDKIIEGLTKGIFCHLDKVP